MLSYGQLSTVVVVAWAVVPPIRGSFLASLIVLIEYTNFSLYYISNQLKISGCDLRQEFQINSEQLFEVYRQALDSNVNNNYILVKLTLKVTKSLAKLEAV